MAKVDAKITAPARPMTQTGKRTLTLEKSRVILTEYNGGKIGQRGILANHGITQPTLTYLIKGAWFKDWEIYPWFVELRQKAQEVAASRSAKITKSVSARMPEASKVCVDVSTLARFDADVKKLLVMRPMLVAKAAKSQLQVERKPEPA
ncbi:MAG: hypothetical protein WB608_24925 [Terracidiphilus sp.]